MTSASPRRVVLDPNVIISAAITASGSLARIVALIDAGTVVPLVTQHLLDEVAEVLARPKLRRYIESATAEAFCAELGHLAEWHSDPLDPPAVCRDPDDDYLIALAVAAHADALVSGDADLHAVTNPGVAIITPRELLDRLDS